MWQLIKSSTLKNLRQRLNDGWAACDDWAAKCGERDLKVGELRAELAMLRAELVAERNTSATLRGRLMAEAHAAGVPVKTT